MRPHTERRSGSRGAARVAACCAAVLLTGATLGAAASSAAPGTAVAARKHVKVARLEAHPILKILGIPRMRTVRLLPRFTTGFERDADLAGFYATPQSPLTRHEVQRGNAHSGERAHVGWLTGATGIEPIDGPNHRGYPTIQLQKTASGPCPTPCLAEFWARVDGFDIKRGEWLSLATFSPDGTDRWSRVITVNVGWEGWLHLFHVPDQNLGQRAFQRTDLLFPRGRWVRVTTWLDLHPDHGAAAVWQDGSLVSAARVRGGDGSLDQMHFGLYAHPALTSGSVRNDDVSVLRARRRVKSRR